jgi:NADPH:quinone reductase-like Zn-dependent oxidoreductase
LEREILRRRLSISSITYLYNQISKIHIMAGAKALLTQSIKSPPDVKVVEKDIPDAIPGTAVVQVLAAGIGPGRGYLISHDVPGFSFPVPSVYGSSAVGRVVSVGSDAVSIKEGQLVLVDPFATARDDSNVDILVGLMALATASPRS